MPMAEETTAEFLRKRQRELASQISALKGQLAPKEAELAQINQMMMLLEAPPNLLLTPLPQQNSNAPVNYYDALKPFLPADNEQLAPIYRTEGLQLPRSPSTTRSYEQMTIKELVIQALLDHFPTGTNLALLRDFIRDAYRRTIEPSSLRPQMHRLKADRVLFHDPASDLWNLDPRKRALYRMYDHPTSRAAMKELQDEPMPKANKFVVEEDDDDPK
jgi:hypothetical protein